MKFNKEESFKWIAYAQAVIFFLAFIGCIWIGNKLMFDGELFDSVVGSIMVTFGMVMLVLSNTMIDVIWQMKINKRLKALEELHRTEFAAKTMSEMAIALSIGIIAMEQVKDDG